MSDWYYAANNEQKGPINESELKANFASNKLPVETLVWKDGMDNWTPANQLPAFTFRPPPTPAKLQPPVTSDATVKPAAAPVTAAVTNPDSTQPVIAADFMGAPESLAVTTDDAEKNKVFGIVAYLGILCFVPILFAKDSPFAKYHANQGLTLFLLEIAISIGLYVIDLIIFSILPALSILTSILSLVHLLPLVLLVLGIINAAAGKCVPLPIIGGVKLLK